MPELRWLGDQGAKRAARRVPYRLLEPVETIGDPQSGNWLIQGDNLDALKALMPFYAGRVKCVFIDPPYNTQSAFAHYDDNLEHSQWLSMMYPRLELLRDLLAEDGSIWATIDDNEGHYLKVLMDEVMGRKNFVATLAWHKRISPANDAKYFSADIDHVLVYAKRLTAWVPNRLTRSEAQLNYYKNPDNDPRGPWNSAAYTCAKTADERPNLFYAIKNPTTGEDIWPSRTRVWAYDRAAHERNEATNLVYWGKGGRASMPRIKKFLNETKPVVPRTLWRHDEAGHNQESRIEIDELFPDIPFTTPKPERLIQRVLEISSRTGDLVLDSFLGSGTSAAVSHKMGRNWIGVEMGEHAKTHCLPRLRKVVEGEQGGISQVVGWKGGGGFKFLKLGAPAFEADGRINSKIGFATLAAYLWFLESGSPHPTRIFDSPLLGVNNGSAIILLYNGILGDRRPEGGNVLTQAVWKAIVDVLPPHSGPRIIYGEACRLSPARLKSLNATFRQIPYDIRMR